ncbi:glycosyltransferase [Leptospira yasudae]|uniref:glycosyltransferase family 2 protein n=1 Tax=Leptospira yasudae TaxID=2202201 RepID=UPI00108469EE|nr:glycosyltransferase family 2 protein [Leptospira yasudae]TGK24547.1 glycosyltransferase [Leptospira yasudae]TGM05667.1 glycosyltransferase [Leptospira yasudae]
MKKPKVSIITINFNDHKGLEKTILSVRSQSFKDYEHIIIDAASKDGSVDVIQKYKDGISKWVSEKDKGIYDGQNKGILAAKGEYCLFLNSGDFLANSTVLADVFSKDSDADFIYGDMLIDYGNGIIKYGKSPEDLDLYFLSYGVLWHCVTFIRRSLFKKYGIYDLSYKIAADVDFFLKAIGAGGANWEYVPKPISQFNTFGFGSNPKNQRLLEEERERMRQTHLSSSAIILLEKYHRMQKDYRILSYFYLPQLLQFFRNIPFLKSLNGIFFRFLNRK